MKKRTKKQPKLGKKDLNQQLKPIAPKSSMQYAMF